MTPSAFDEDKRTEFMHDLAANLEVESDRVQIRGFSAGSLVVDTRILGMKSVSEASAMASRVKRKTSSGALLSPRFGPCTAANIATVEEEPDMHADMLPSPKAPVPGDLTSMSVKELKKLARDRAVDTSTCLDKMDLISAIEASLEPLPAMHAPRSPVRRPTRESEYHEAEALRDSEYQRMGGAVASAAEVGFSGYTMAEPVVAQRVEEAVDAIPVEPSTGMAMTWAVNDIKSFVDRQSTSSSTERGSAELAAALEQNMGGNEQAAARGASAHQQRKQEVERQFAVPRRVTNRSDPRAAAAESDDEETPTTLLMDAEEEEPEDEDRFVGPVPTDWSAASMRLHRHGRSVTVAVRGLDFDVSVEEVKQTFYVSIFVAGVEQHTVHTPNLVGGVRWASVHRASCVARRVAHS